MPTDARIRAWKRRAIPGLLVPMALLAGLVAPAGAAQRSALTTPHYEVASTISPEFTRLLADHMEAIYKEYTTRMGSFYKGGQGRFAVVVFETEAEYLAELGPAAAGSAGMFVPDRRLLAGWLGNRPPQALFRVLYHEGFHQFVFNCISRTCPIWLNEGMAEYFSEATWTGKSFSTGEVSVQRLRVLREALRKGDYVPLLTLVTMTPDVWAKSVQSRSASAGLNYVEAWSLVHFLINGDGGRYRARFGAYVKKIAENADPEDAFTGCFGKNVDAMEAAWKKHVMGLEPGDKSVCTLHMAGLCLLLKSAIDGGQTVGDAEDLFRLLQRGDWSVTVEEGYTFGSRERQGAAELMRCPARKGGGLGYRLERMSGGRYPEIVCTNHPGIILVGHMVRDPGTGQERPEVVESVRARSSMKFLESYLKKSQ